MVRVNYQNLISVVASSERLILVYAQRLSLTPSSAGINYLILVTPNTSHSLLCRRYPTFFLPRKRGKDSNMTEELSLVQMKYVNRKKERRKEGTCSQLLKTIVPWPTLTCIC
jgi:hypothetical protein